MVQLEWYIWLATALFCIGVFGFLSRRNIIIVLMSIELMLNAVNISLVAFSHYMGDIRGHIIAFFVITVAAAEAAIGLAIIIALFRNKHTTNVDEMTELSG